MRLKADNAIPIRDVHVQSLKFAWEQHPVVSNEVSGFLHLVHSLFKPMLSWNDVSKMIPLGYHYLGKLPEIDEAK
jgi:hypothetical protein